VPSATFTGGTMDFSDFREPTSSSGGEAGTATAPQACRTPRHSA